MAAVVKSNDILGTGRRKSSVARVRIRSGEGKISINGRGLEEYFHCIRQRNAVLAPLEQTSQLGQLDVIIRVGGGGITGQADACKLGIARALKKSDEQIADPRSWPDFITETPPAPRRLLAHPAVKAAVKGDAALFLPGPVVLAVGPEGGFTDDEVVSAVAAGWQTVNLGPRILRVETASLLLVARVVSG